ncbi:MAG: hypothetical protein GX103_15395 [Bacteroidales bacterium]|nr:hypothetical protein [Bacteroidales bacterium]
MPTLNSYFRRWDILSPLQQPLLPLPSIRIFLSLKTFRRRVGYQQNKEQFLETGGVFL